MTRSTSPAPSPRRATGRATCSPCLERCWPTRSSPRWGRASGRSSSPGRRWRLVRFVLWLVRGAFRLLTWPLRRRRVQPLPTLRPPRRVSDPATIPIAHHDGTPEPPAEEPQTEQPAGERFADYELPPLT